MANQDLAQALKDAGMADFVELFKAKGCRTFSDLGPDKNTVFETVKSVIGDKGPGYVNRVVQLWAQASKPVVVEGGLTTALTEAGYGDLAKLFTAAGYLELTHLGGDESSALAAIKEILKDKPGAVRPILGLWKKAHERLKRPTSLSSPLATDLVKAGLKPLAIALTEAGYRKWEDLGGDQKTARDAIKLASPTSPAGDVERAVQLWVQASKPVVVEEAATPCGLTTALTEAGYGDLAKLFTKGGYLELTHLGGDESSALASIKDILKDKPGAVRPILGLWKKAHERLKPPTSLSSALTEAGYGDLAELFTKAGYREFKDLGARESAALATINNVLKEKPGAVMPILMLWRKAAPIPT